MSDIYAFVIVDSYVDDLNLKPSMSYEKIYN